MRAEGITVFKIKVGDSDAVLATTHLVKLLTHPPSEPAIVEHRRAMIRLSLIVPALAAAYQITRQRKYADRAAYPFPALFLLDLKMPVKDGLEVLRWLHDHPEIPGKLPVVVLSSTELPTETQMAYAMDIQACIVKPLSYEELREKIRVLKDYWLAYEAEAAPGG